MSLMNLLAMPVRVWPTDPASCLTALRSCLAWKVKQGSSGQLMGSEDKHIVYDTMTFMVIVLPHTAPVSHIPHAPPLTLCTIR